MILPDVWGKDGQLFAYSGMDGETDVRNQLVGSSLEHSRGYLLHTDPPLSICFTAAIDSQETSDFTMIEDSVIASDIASSIISIDKDNKVKLSWVFADMSTLLVRIDALNVCGKISAGIKLECDAVKEISGSNTLRIYTPHWSMLGISNKATADLCSSCLVSTFASVGDSAEFVISFGRDIADVFRRAEDFLQCDFVGIFRGRLKYFASLPEIKCSGTGVEKAFAKCASVMKVNCLSPQGQIRFPWTTPDRWPHRDMWIWDSAFHAIGLRHISESWAENAIKAVLSRVHENGFVAHRMGVDEESTIIQPPILAWAAWKVYEKTDNLEFIEYGYPRLVKMIEYDLRERDSDGNGLAEWNDGDSSGMDNSPRFDSPVKDALDLNCFLANEMKYLSQMAAVLGNRQDMSRWSEASNNLADLINRHLWDEDSGFYFDSNHRNEFIKVKSEAGFTPLFAGIASKAQAERLVQHLLDPGEFWRAFPVSSVAGDEPTFSDNMWRGPVWINYNYLIIEGLLKYGYADIAQDIRQRTICEIMKWYEEDGVIYEYYDSETKISPIYLHRKSLGGPNVSRLSTLGTTVCDYNWTAALFVDMCMEAKDLHPAS